MPTEAPFRENATHPLRDIHGRFITYLRLSVTDRCNLRCTYCRPDGSIAWLDHEDILTYEEILLIVRAAALLGVRKVRLTGGEPLMRKGLPGLAREIARLDGIREICLTTNGLLLEAHAKDLLDAGVRHLNISLDTLRPGRFASITGVDAFERVMCGIRKALELGFPRIKINAVVMRDVNDDEVADLARLTMEHPLEVRFIEFMPIGTCLAWSPDRFIPCEEVKGRVEETLGALVPIDPERDAGPARLYRIPGAPGNVGFISPLSRHFCATCNRVRITPDGKLRLCLFSDEEQDIRGVIREGAGASGDPEDGVLRLVLFLEGAVMKKPAGHGAVGPAEREGQGEGGGRRGMSRIGG